MKLVENLKEMTFNTPVCLIRFGTLTLIIKKLVGESGGKLTWEINIIVFFLPHI